MIGVRCEAVLTHRAAPPTQMLLVQQPLRRRPHTALDARQRPGRAGLSKLSAFSGWRLGRPVVVHDTGSERFARSRSS